MKKFLLLFVFGAMTFRAQADPTPLIHSHAHNDYNHKRPLLDALDHGFCSIEADVHLTNGMLLVAHDLKKARENHSLESLYLKPLQERVLKNNGRVFRHAPSLILLIDLKTEPRATWIALRELLGKYSGMLTKFGADKVETNAVTVLLTGNRSVEILAKETNRLAACDGLMSDLNSKISPDLIPLVSGEWKRFFRWKGEGEMPDEEKARLRNFVSRAHAAGRKIRFWGTPDSPIVWKELLDAKVDLLNADDLPGLEKFLRGSER